MNPENTITTKRGRLFGHAVSEETRLKISLSKKGKPSTSSTKFKPGDHPSPKTEYKRGHTPHHANTRKYQSFACKGCKTKCIRYLPPSRKPYQFCSDKCKGRFKVGQKHHNWKGGNALVGGYNYIWLSPDKREYEHRVVAEKVMGRKLKTTETVHHINAIKNDNVNNNLLICETGYHRMLERLMSTIYQLQYFGGRTHEEAVVEARAALKER